MSNLRVKPTDFEMQKKNRPYFCLKYQVPKLIFPPTITVLRMLFLMLCCNLLDMNKVLGQAGNTTYRVDKTDTATSSEISSKSPAELVNLANSTALTSPVRSMSYAAAALEKSIKEKDQRTQCQAYNSMGMLYFNSGNYAGAQQYFQLALDGFNALKDTKNSAYSARYLEMAKSKLNALRESDAKKKAAYSKKSKVSKAEVSKYKSESFKGKKDQEVIDIYTELGNYYLENKDTLQAVNYLNKAADNSYAASDSVLLLNAKNLNKAYTSTGNNQANITYQWNVREEGLKRGSPEIVASAAHNLGFAYVQAQQPERAIPFLNESITVSLKEGDVVQKQRSVKELARAYEEMGQYDKALKVIKEYINTMDSFVALQGANESANLELNEEFLRQQGRIQKLLATQIEKENDIKRQHYIVWGLSLALLVFGGLIYMLIRNIRQKQRANMQIKLQSLRAQMNPHFIFNSLNSVNNFISKNDERSANKYLSDFSRLMRTVLSNSDQDFVSLETEVDTMKIYLELEHFRFGEKFDYQLEIADDIDPEIIRVPPMLIQPYIENAIWHGLRYKEEKGILNVRIFTENDLLYCTVKDNGIGRKKSAALKTDHQKTYQSTGIKNTKERIELLNKMHGTRLNVSILDLEENGNAAGTLVRISVPYIMQQEEI
jgi:hypothetical protein